MPHSFDVRPSRRSDDSRTYPLSFLHLTDSSTQRALLNPFAINPLRTLFIATEGVVCVYPVPPQTGSVPDVQTFRSKRYLRAEIPTGSGRSDDHLIS